MTVASGSGSSGGGGSISRSGYNLNEKSQKNTQREETQWAYNSGSGKRS